MNVGGGDYLLASNGISVAFAFVVDVDEVFFFQAFEAGENEFEVALGVDVAGGVAGYDEVADFSRQGVGSWDGKMGNTVMHGSVDAGLVVGDAKCDRDADAEFGNKKEWGGSDVGCDGRVDFGDFGGFDIPWRDIGHDRGDEVAVVLEKEDDKYNR